MSLPHYSPSEMKLLIKHLQPEVSETFNRFDADKKRYLGSVILTDQLGGNPDTFAEIRRGNENIRRIATNLIKDIKLHFNKLKLTEKQNEDLTQEVRDLKLRIKELEESSADNSKRLEEECNNKINKYEVYLNRFASVQTALARLVGKIQELTLENSSTLNVLSKYGDFSAQGYEKLWQKIKELKDTIPTDISCSNVDAALQILENYGNPQLYQRILDDFEDISGTVRVYVRILNRSLFDEAMKVKEQKFSHIIGRTTVTNKNGVPREVLKKQRSEHTYSCNEDLCPTAQSVKRAATGRFVERTKYPCNDTDEMVKFKPTYGPFFSVFENDTNEIVFKGTNKDPGIAAIMKQVLTGTDVILFSYGLSGSGKSHSLLGNPSEKGMVQMAIDELLLNNANIRLEMEELYGKINPRKKYDRVDEQYIKYDSIQINDSKTILLELERVNKLRQEAGRIKFTPNNPESSRSHLFLKFKIQHKGKNSMLTFIDMAGVENPFIIAQTFLPIDVNNMKRLNRETIKSLITDISNPQSEKGDSDRFSITVWPKKFLNYMQQNGLTGEQRQGTSQSQGGYIMGSTCKNKVTIQDVLPYDQSKEMIQIKFNEHCDSYDDLMKKLFIHHFRKNIFKNDQVFESLFGSKYAEKANIDKIVDYIWNMLQEGYYINETLNHLRIFLLKRMGKAVNVVNVSNYKQAKRDALVSAEPLSVFSTITSEQFTRGDDFTSYTNDKMFTNPLPAIESSSFSMNYEVNMVSLLRSLFRDNTDKRPKFVMMVNVRTDLSDIACAGTADTLAFADSVKST